MNVIEKYYLRKATRGVKDDYHTRIDEGDLDILRKSKFYMVLAPCVTFGAVYMGY